MSKTIYKLKVNKLILKKEYVITDELYNELMIMQINLSLTHLIGTIFIKED